MAISKWWERYTLLNTLRNIKHGSVRRINQLAINWAERRVISKTKSRVLSGPFKGTQLINRHVFGSHIPKLLGTYELELQAVLKTFMQRDPKIVCNIGGAEGFYAIGCSRQPSVDLVIVYEGLELGQELIQANSRINNVCEKIDIRGFCDEEQLHALLREHAIDLMMIDIEGSELDILSARNIKALQNTNLIIESHDFCRPNCIEILTERLTATHCVEVIQSRERCSEDVITKIGIPEFVMKKLIDEKRPGTMFWAGCTPKEP